MTIADAAQAMGARVTQGTRDQLATHLGPVSTDTRTMPDGALLFALKGTRFDAHDHLTTAVLARAAAVVVSRLPPGLTIPDNCVVLLVEDTLVALGRLGTAWAVACERAYCDAQSNHRVVRIGLSGSSGKTTTKEMLADVLAAAKVSAWVTPGNLNNLIGLPQTMLALTPEHRAAVLELGMNQPGEARELVRIAQPHVLLLTNINNAHVGMFGTLEDLYEAECDSLRHAPDNCTLVINRDDPNSRRAQAEHAGNRPVVTLSSAQDTDEWNRADWVISSLEPLTPYGYQFLIHQRSTGASAPVTLRVFGSHNAANALAAAAIACDPRCGLGLDLPTTATALSAFRPRLNRSEIEECDGWWVIKDFYNAVPAAVEAALGALKDVHVPGRRLALLTEMRELGDLYEECHLRVARVAAKSALDHLYTVGDRARILHEEALRQGIRGATHFDTKEQATEFLRQTLKPGDLLLLKGARLIGLETVYEALTGRHAHVH
jgi:UDP-N-acetylmuramoyl-tripeptide--D-alanyl-D-alanine ligase